MIDKTLMLDFKTLKENDISIGEFLYLTNIYYTGELNLPEYSINLNRLEENKLIKIINGVNILREKSINLIEMSLTEISISIDDKKVIKKSKRYINSEIESRITEYRNK
tara:strand:- start:7426 stop:7752 length:327 start_codon:yes stop_codon:yes gene_type:complete